MRSIKLLLIFAISFFLLAATNRYRYPPQKCMFVQGEYFIYMHIGNGKYIPKLTKKGELIRCCSK